MSMGNRPSFSRETKLQWAGSRERISPSGRGGAFFLTSLFIELIDRPIFNVASTQYTITPMKNAVTPLGIWTRRTLQSPFPYSPHPESSFDTRHPRPEGTRPVSTPAASRFDVVREPDLVPFDNGAAHEPIDLNSTRALHASGRYPSRSLGAKIVAALRLLGVSRATMQTE